MITSKPKFLVSALAIFFTGLALGAPYPSQPLTIVLPQPAGSATDVIIRLVAEKMSPGLNQPIIIDNRPGASGAIAGNAVAKAAPDGYTLFACTSSTEVVLPLANPKMPYSPSVDLAPVGIVSRADNVLIVPSTSKFKTFSDLVEFGKTHPDALSHGTAGIGTTNHLATELLQSIAGFQAVHVPYKGSSLAETDLVAGRLDFILSVAAPALPNIQAGRTRAILVTSASRNPSLPNVPTSREVGLKDFEVYTWAGLCAPARTPKPVIDRLNTELVKAVSRPELRARLQELGFDGKAGTPLEQAALTRSDSARWLGVIKQRGIKFE